jgi:hypothetical protein
MMIKEQLTNILVEPILTFSLFYCQVAVTLNFYSETSKPLQFDVVKSCYFSSFQGNLHLVNAFKKVEYF